MRPITKPDMEGIFHKVMSEAAPYLFLTTPEFDRKSLADDLAGLYYHIRCHSDAGTFNSLASRIMKRIQKAESGSAGYGDQLEAFLREERNYNARLSSLERRVNRLDRGREVTTLSGISDDEPQADTHTFTEAPLRKRSHKKCPSKVTEEDKDIVNRCLSNLPSGLSFNELAENIDIPSTRLSNIVTTMVKSGELGSDGPRKNKVFYHAKFKNADKSDNIGLSQFLYYHGNNRRGRRDGRRKQTFDKIAEAGDRGIKPAAIGESLRVPIRTVMRNIANLKEWIRTDSPGKSFETEDTYYAILVDDPRYGM